MTRAKFKVDNKGPYADGFRISLIPVIGDSDANPTFFKYTPAGKIEMSTLTPEVAETFEIGKEYFVDFTPVNR